MSSHLLHFIYKLQLSRSRIFKDVCLSIFGDLENVMLMLPPFQVNLFVFIFGTSKTKLVNSSFGKNKLLISFILLSLFIYLFYSLSRNFIILRFHAENKCTLYIN